MLQSLINYLSTFSVLEFGFRCGSPAHDTGISIPLISVSIAGLMAIFIDPNLAFTISESAVTVAIRQACSALLDHRLSATSSSVGIGLEPNTCKKMVKAINKVSSNVYKYNISSSKSLILIRSV